MKAAIAGTALARPAEMLSVWYSISIGNHGNKQGEKEQKERERERKCGMDDTGTVGWTRLMPEFLRRG